ncbi:MAG: L-alanine-DL-glutamate epimerase-like enolase superfamily enzyme [Cellvibrionaceae bacterium]|jgi:L-alanine-DL-glutamate epimerase-like enolase superfamily enzyme
MLISHIETVPFQLPMHGELKWGKYSGFSEVRHVLVKVFLKDGAVGMAEAVPRPTIYGETVESICHIIKHELAPRVVGRPVEFDLFSQSLLEIKNNQTAKGAIDMALHDAVAQANGITLADQLGVTRDTVRVSYILGVGDNDTMLAEAERVYNLGVRVLKVKIGRDWAADLERIQLLRQIGSDLDLYVDANETLVYEGGAAADRLDKLAAEGVLYCEEPLPIEQVVERADLQNGDHMPLIGDDSCFSLRDVKRELALNTFDILNIKCARSGFTESKKMAGLAVAHDKGIMVGSQASSRLGASRHAIFAGRPEVNHPSEVSFFLKMKSDIVADPILLKDGYLKLSDLANIKVDDDLLKDHLLRH